jgi:HlyD family secretion protein
MMRILRIMLITLMLSGIAVPLVGCTSKSNRAPLSENQVITVQRGDLRTDITAAGNLALSLKENLAFEIAGTVEEVLVEEGDSVEQGQVLATLDTSEWEDQLEVLENMLVATERQLTARERGVTAAEIQLEAKRRSVIAKERDLLQAEINLKNAELALLAQAKDTYPEWRWPDIETAQADVDDARAYLEWAQRGLAEATTAPEITSWSIAVTCATSNLEVAKVRFDAKLPGSDKGKMAPKKLQVGLAEERLEDAKEAVEIAQQDIEEAQKDIEDAQIAVEDAQKDVEDAQEALDEVLNTSVEITAPFDGFITKVNVEGGDEVLKGTVAVTIANPDEFEADILVSEMDILQVELGGEAWVQVDAMQGLSLPAEVTHISPTATIQSGVVNYEVTVEVQSLETVMQEQQEAMEKIQQGELPEHLRQAVEEERITQEQAEEKLKQVQKAQGGQQGQVPTAIPEDFQLREGLTVTVSILVDEKHDVLLVPNQVITQQGGKIVVQVLKDGVIELRSITTGISNWQYTEVTEGLSEGEQLIVPQGTVTTTTTPQQQKPPQKIVTPRMGK